MLSGIGSGHKSVKNYRATRHKNKDIKLLYELISKSNKKTLILYMSNKGDNIKCTYGSIEQRRLLACLMFIADHNDYNPHNQLQLNYYIAPDKSEIAELFVEDMIFSISREDFIDVQDIIKKHFLGLMKKSDKSTYINTRIAHNENKLAEAYKQQKKWGLFRTKTQKNRIDRLVYNLEKKKYDLILNLFESIDPKDWTQKFRIDLDKKTGDISLYYMQTNKITISLEKYISTYHTKFSAENIEKLTVPLMLNSFSNIVSDDILTKFNNNLHDFNEGKGKITHVAKDIDYNLMYEHMKQKNAKHTTKETSNNKKAFLEESKLKEKLASIATERWYDNKKISGIPLEADEKIDFLSAYIITLNETPLLNIIMHLQKEKLSDKKEEWDNFFSGALKNFISESMRLQTKKVKSKTDLTQFNRINSYTTWIVATATLAGEIEPVQEDTQGKIHFQKKGT